MKTRNKALLLVLCAMLLVVASIFGTLAYLTDTETVTNTFTVGSVAIKLDEAKVDVYGAKDGDTRVTENTYKLLPGHKYTKDPTVTVVDKSEPSYVRMLVTVNDISKLKTAIPANETNAKYYMNGKDGGMFLLQELVTGWNSTVWESVNYTEVTDNTTNITAGTYEFRYHTTVDARNGEQKLDALFDEIVIPGTLDNDQISALNQVVITVEAHAIQADGFTTADAAWAAFTTPNN